MKKTAKDYSHIKGWGIDADPLDVPNYPIKRRTENDNKGMVWERPPQQPELVEVLHSSERPSLSSVFGSPNPPKGISGHLRRYAFKYSESNWLHWLLLLVADRVDSMEHIQKEIVSGHCPDFFTELGGKSELQYNKTGLIRKVATGAGIAILVIAFIKMRSDK